MLVTNTHTLNALGCNAVDKGAMLLTILTAVDNYLTTTHPNYQVSSGAWPPLPAPLERSMLVDSAAAVAPHLVGAGGTWGRMDMDK